jgi:fucose 4-O-acetylase-like acetyltransferase
MREYKDNKPERKYYIDNLRWACILLLIPFHAAMAWNSWGEGNYVWYQSNRFLSSFILFVSPWYMPLMFVIAGISARMAMKRRSSKAFAGERMRKLFLPLAAGLLTIAPIMSYIGDCYNNGYTGNFFSHYFVYFTKFTTLNGYDGGFTPAHLWFLLYLFIILKSASR